MSEKSSVTVPLGIDIRSVLRSARATSEQIPPLRDDEFAATCPRAFTSEPAQERSRVYSTSPPTLSGRRYPYFSGFSSSFDAKNWAVLPSPEALRGAHGDHRTIAYPGASRQTTASSSPRTGHDVRTRVWPSPRARTANAAYGCKSSGYACTIDGYNATTMTDNWAASTTAATPRAASAHHRTTARCSRRGCSRTTDCPTPVARGATAISGA